ncbi:DEAD/DEAH box helicase [Wenzhouxiangella marina]|uniref:ATP-dependent DNA helicase n=1 Tax=Wenzhouxiangella marina TaxID=1579979 RepID=A0A0K0XW71_9GAMM|nr:DEAD/DEAH box helicase [Wenzhouxiangella marina]AKS41954.1 ATP-dependent DNA helicase [Wenzhouxiangella marina]MBB6086279.1 ATP-dependent Lhr-like helicase [Wenzhouxiangella marina]
MLPSTFSPKTRAWFQAAFDEPTPIQREAWPRIQAGEHVLISAPTGAGKSLAAWLPLLDRLHRAPQSGERRVRLLYLSPLRALSRDMAQSMLERMIGPNSGPAEGLSIGLRTGDTSPRERAAQRRRPPDVLLTTPESLFVLLGSRGGRSMLAGVEAVIIDEVHALIENKRGDHLSLSLERLQALVNRPIQRIGLSATARPLERVASFLVGQGRDCRIVDWGAPQSPSLRIETPPLPLGHFAGQLHWAFIEARLIELAEQAGTMLVFCNTRALVERLGHRLADALGEDRVASHHGSLGHDRRQVVEQGLKSGTLKVVVCSSSLELGIDIGPLERVCQIGSCQSINTFRQRAGRARHRPGELGRIHAFPLSLSDRLDLAAMESALDQSDIDPVQPRSISEDVLAQQLLAEVATGEGRIQVLLQRFRRAWPFRALELETLDAVIDMLHDGFVPGRETGRGPLQRLDRDRLEASEWIDRLSLVNAGTIPEWFEYEVISDKGRLLGRLDEEFAFESSPGQVLSLGGQSWRILRIGPGHVEVEASEDEAPNLPFWFGDGAGRSQALSRRVQGIMDASDSQPGELGQWLETSRQQLGRLPSATRIVIERFYDPGGDQHLVLHSLFGARLNRGWGLALRKRFCRGFNFELQAAATDNGVLISLGAVHSFALEDVIRWLTASSIEPVLTQALLDTPIFQTRLRWCANNALAIARRDLRGRVPAQLQRSQTENLIARIFPDQLACLENLSGERRIPDHPLVRQAMRDCLEEHMDLPGLIALYRSIESGTCEVHCVDRQQPSLLSEAMIHAPRSSFLDPAAAEERRTRSFETPARNRGSAATFARPPEELATARGLMSALNQFGYLRVDEGERAGAAASFRGLSSSCAALVVRPDGQRRFWVALERLSQVLAVWPKATIGPFLSRAQRPRPDADADEALARLLLGRVRYLGAGRSGELASETGLPVTTIEAALARLEAEGLLERITEEDEKGSWRERLACQGSAPANRGSGSPSGATR